MNTAEKKSKLALVLSMLIFATIGIFRRYIPLSSSLLAMIRGFVGMLFLLLFVLVRGNRISWKSVRENLLPLFASGALLGFNWILLFEAYQYTSVATATLCYYMAPIFVILVSPIFFRESLTPKKIICVAAALAGMVLVSGVLKAGFGGMGEMKGILFGLGAAVFYASVILLNKKIKDISAYDKTIMQLGTAAVTLLPYTIVTGGLSGIALTPLIVAMLLVVGVVHTGVAYVLYFGSMKDLKAQTVALFSYIDPIGAVLLSALFLQESMSGAEIAGAMLVLCAAMVSELPERE